jgi:methylmalonyl-CoA mutase
VGEFAKRHGRQPRLLMAKLGQDGHDRGAKVVAAGLSDLGFDVDIGPLFQTPAEAVRDAIDNDVHVVGVSTQAGAHRLLVKELCEALSSAGADDIVVVCGGVVPVADRAQLQRAGVEAFFDPGAKVVEIGARLLSLIEARDPDGP